MSKTSRPRCVGQSSYAAPKCNVVEIKTEGILCLSMAWADKIIKEDELTGDDYFQIF